MSVILPIKCQGGHTVVPTLGTVELPDGVTPDVVLRVTSGALCVDCGNAYNGILNLLTQIPFAQYPPGIQQKITRAIALWEAQTPSAAWVDAALTYLGLTRQLPK